MESEKNSLRTCLVDGAIPALFHCWGYEAGVVPPSPMIGGAPGGQYSYPVAVVECEDGQVHVVQANLIQFTDRKGAKE